MQSGLSIKALTTGYPTRRGASPRIVSQNLSLEIAPGELVMLMGVNGCGKSTLMHTIAGLLPPLVGEVCVGGQDVRRQSRQEVARLLSLVLTERVADDMTVREVVRIGRYPHIGYLGKLSPRDERVVQEAMAQCWVQDLQERKLSELSDGQRQRAMIARALAQETPLILLDEPTAHLDLSSRLEVVQMLRHLAHDMGRSILVSTHELELALAWADTIWLMDRQGGLCAGAPEDLVLSGAVERAFASPSLSYDAESGKFFASPHTTKRIALQGQGLELLWTKRALHRCGYELADASSPDYPRLEVVGQEWLLYSGGESYTATSIKELCTLLDRYYPKQ